MITVCTSSGLWLYRQIHAVHWNEDLYSCYEDAAKSNEGIMILAVFLKVRMMINCTYSHCQQTQQIHSKRQQNKIPIGYHTKSINMAKILSVCKSAESSRACGASCSALVYTADLAGIQSSSVRSSSFVIIKAV